MCCAQQSVAPDLHRCYDKDLQTDFYLFIWCTDTGVIVTHALLFYQPQAPLFLLTHAQLAVVTQSCALLYITDLPIVLGDSELRITVHYCAL